MTSTSIFWERFFADAAGKKIVSSDPKVFVPVRELLEGRPLFGSINVSQWAFYSYLYSEQAVALRDFIRADPELSKAFDVESALAWLDTTCEAGLDVWCWVS